MNAVDVLAVIDSHRDHNWMLDFDGRYLEFLDREARRNPTEDNIEALQGTAFNMKAAQDALCCAGRVPVIARHRLAHCKGGAA